MSINLLINEYELFIIRDNQIIIVKMKNTFIIKISQNNENTGWG